MHTEQLTDEAREEAIAVCGHELQTAALTLTERRELWAYMRGLINGRSAETVRRLEVLRGLVKAA